MPTPNVLIMSGSPSQVAPLAPGDQEAAQLRQRTRGLAQRLAQGRAVELVSSQDRRWHTRHTGSFRAWGAPLTTVGAGNHLAELVHRYVTGLRVDSAREGIGKINPQALTVVVVDGSAGMTARAPLALIDSAGDVDKWCRALLSGQPSRYDRQALVAGGIVEPDVWLELADMEPAHADLWHADTTTGVGRYLATWEVH